MKENAMEQAQGLNRPGRSRAGKNQGLLSSRNAKFFAGGAIVVLALAVLLYSSMQGSTVYYLTVSELKAKSTAGAAEDVRVAGKAVDGTIKWDAATQTANFEVADQNGDKMPVIYKGIVPDTFKGGADVVVEGKLDSQGVFQAHTLLSKCPSKYEPAQ
ncbi:MAG: cytochrome c maturation protein CcmE [Chloroflexi bacterium]|nr:cytochrome c maturation protein CcmE [Chloroflexota bacterium]